MQCESNKLFPLSSNCRWYARKELSEPPESPTQVASDDPLDPSRLGVNFYDPTNPFAGVGIPGYGQQFGFPQIPNYQPLAPGLPMAQLQPFVQSRGPSGDTGPAAVAVVGAGAAAGLGWMRRRRK